MKHRLRPNWNKQDVTLVVDGKYLAYRTKYTPQFQLSSGDTKTGIAYGFLNTMRQLATKFKPVNCVIMLDKTPSNMGKRKARFDGYKKREKELEGQELEDALTFADAYDRLTLDLCKLGFACYDLPEYEADDLIALWCLRHNTGTNVIVTRDEDMYQCLNENTEIWNPDDKFFKDFDWFVKTYGISPSNWPMVKAIGGCKSDTIPGVPGIGEATALKYMKGECKPNTTEKIHAHQTMIDLYLELTTLPHNDLWQYFLPFKKTNLDMGGFISYCQQMGFRQFLDKDLADFKLYSMEEQW